ncbi:MAG: glutathione S-transferase N-terminal domain-containing protein [Pseudomonadota bacterium]
MPVKPLAIAALLLLPLSVAVFDLSIGATVVLTLAVLATLWFDVLSGLASRQKDAPYRLETISVSHFAEKVRWCLDRLGVDYVEDVWPGTVGAYYLGRTVPRLHVRTGAVWSRIGNSPEILRFLWAQHASDDGAGFLEPTPERLQLEKRLDRAGSMLQIWVYYHILDDTDLTVRAWGVNDPAVPAWKRQLVRLLVPVQRALIRRTFRISTANYQRACEFIEDTWSDIETRLSDGRLSILGGNGSNYTDYHFAAMTGAWLQPDGYAGQRGEYVRLERLPGAMADDVDRWKQDYPKSVAFTERLYAHRQAPGGEAP